MSEPTLTSWLDLTFGQDESTRFFESSDMVNDVGLDDATVLRYLIELFRQPELLQKYSIVQIGKGFWCLAGWAFFSVRGDAPIELKHEFIDSVPDLYLRIFEPLCEPVTSHGNPHPDANELNSAAYMLWDIAGFCPGISQTFHEESCLAELDQRLTALLGDLLMQVESPASQESILHGLGHGIPYPVSGPIPGMIDRFLEKPEIHPRIRQYAMTSRTGQIL